MGLHAPNVIWCNNRCNNRCHPLPSLLRTCSLKIIITIDLYTILGTLVLHVLSGSKLIWGSALSIIPKRLLYFPGIPLSRLSTTTTTIYGFNAGSSHPLGKIRLRCQIGDLKSEVTCYVIDADTSYNLLLGRPWIHANWIIPSILHQCSKYVGHDAVIRTVFIKVQPFKEVENYFTDSLLYQKHIEPLK